MNPPRIVAVAFVAVAAALGSASADAATAGRTITVSGTGIVTTVPNQAQFNFGVSTTGRTAQAALGANATRMNRVIDALRSLGISSANLQTAQVTLTPNMNQNGTAVVDFSASNSVNATTDNVGKSGAIVDAAVGAGANLVSGPSLTPSDQLLLSRKALGAAIRDARARALAIAVAAGVSLGRVETVTEQSSTPPVLPFTPARASVGQSTPVEPGTVQTEEDVTVTYAIA